MRLVFFGSPDFAVPSLRALVAAGHDIRLVVTQPSRPRGRSGSPVPTEVMAVACELGLPAIEAESLKSEDIRSRIFSAEADLGVVVAYGCILPKAVFESFPKGTINLHGSLLPKYRGAAPIQWAVMRGDAHTGVSVQRLVKALDAGPVFASRETAIGAEETAGQLFDRLAPLGAELLVEVVRAIGLGTAVAVPQDEGLATHAPKLSKDDGWIDWSQPPSAIAAFIRGMTPWPGARSQVLGPEVKNETLQVLRVEALPEASNRESIPGSLSLSSKEMRVACGPSGRGALRILEVVPAGRKSMAADAYLRGRSLPEGCRLGREAAKETKA